MTLGEKIRSLRKAKLMSQGELAAQIGAHVTHISRLEKGRYSPSLEILKKLAETFEVTLDFLAFENMEDLEPAKLKDKTLYEKMKIIDTLEEKDRGIITGVIDAFLVKQQMWGVLKKLNAQE